MFLCLDCNSMMIPIDTGMISDKTPRKVKEESYIVYLLR